MKLEKLTTLKEIAQERGVNYHTLRYWLNKTKVKQEKMGTTILIRKSDVPKIIAAGNK